MVGSILFVLQKSWHFQTAEEYGRIYFLCTHIFKISWWYLDFYGNSLGILLSNFYYNLIRILLFFILKMTNLHIGKLDDHRILMKSLSILGNQGLKTFMHLGLLDYTCFECTISILWLKGQGHKRSLEARACSFSRLKRVDMSYSEQLFRVVFSTYLFLLKNILATALKSYIKWLL